MKVRIGTDWISFSAERIKEEYKRKEDFVSRYRNCLQGISEEQLSEVWDTMIGSTEKKSRKTRNSDSTL